MTDSVQCCLVSVITMVMVHGLVTNALSSPKPNIVFIVADDMGHADIGYNNPYMKTPVLDNLAKSGVILTQSYVQPLCTASRNAFLTGRYPFKTGLQHMVIPDDRPSCLPTDIKILPQYLKEQGYSTHAVGKWHLGFCNWNCTPTYRGFDSFYGPLTGGFDYYTHKSIAVRGQQELYLDFRDNKKPVMDSEGKYATTLFTEKAVRIIDTHNNKDPLFLYLPYTSPHSPLQVPSEYEKRCANISDANRRTFCGMVASLDDGIGQVVDALRRNKLYENTILVFTTDNGGQVSASGYNWPLKGQKSTIWEGGTRGPAFIHSPLLKQKGAISNQMIHAVDWFSTFISLAGGSLPEGVDSLDQTDMILSNGESRRTEFVYNLDNYTSLITSGNAAIRVGDYKLIKWLPGPPGMSKWYVPPEYEQDGTRNNMADRKSKHRFSRSVRMDQKKSRDESSLFTKLYNLKFDPEERDNLVSKLPDVVARLEARLEVHMKQMVKPIWPPQDPASDPKNFGNVWSPGWC